MINNVPLTLPWAEDFETAGNYTYTSNTQPLNGSGMGEWSFETVSPGRLRTQAGYYHGGTHAATIESNSFGTWGEGYVIATLNLSNYVGITDLDFSFFYNYHSYRQSSPEDRVWIRGSVNDSWIEVYDLNANREINYNWKEASNIDLSYYLRTNGQDVSSTFQIKFGQKMRYYSSTEGISFDDLNLGGTIPVNNDAGVVAITGPTVPFAPGSQSVSATLKNFGLNTLTSAKVDWTVNSTAQTQQSWAGSLTSGQSASQSLGSFTMADATVYTIVTNSSNPNATTDNKTANDTFTGSLAAALSGTYTIGGTSPTFNTFADAANYMTNYGVYGPVIFDVRSGTYTEQLVLSEIPGVSATNTVTFRSQSGNPADVILTYSSTSSSSNYTVSLSGANYVIFRNMSISATNTSNGRVVEIIDNASNNTFVNVTFNGISTSSTSDYYAVIYSSNTVSSYNTFDTCRILNGSYGIYFYSNSSGSSSINTTTNNCDITNQYYCGIYNQYLIGVIITNNRISTNSTYNGYYGIRNYWIRILDDSNKPLITGNRITGAVGGYGIYNYYIGVNSSVSTARRPLIANNMIQIGSGSNSAVGMRVSNEQNSDYLYNTVHVTSTNTSSSSAAAYFNSVYSSGNTNTIRNNIFVGSNGAPAMYVGSTSTGLARFNPIDYNNLYTTGPNLAYHGSTAYSDLSSWKSATSRDANSISQPPYFVSSTDLHVKVDSMRVGTPLTSLATTDYDGETRSITTPYIGADEARENDAGVTAMSVATDCAAPINVVATLKNYGANYLTSATINWMLNGVAQTAFNWTGSIAVDSSANVVVGTNTLAAGTYSLIGYSSVPNGTTDLYTTNDTGTGIVTIYPKPVAAFSTSNVCYGLNMNFTDGSSVSSGSVAAWAWSFGDATTSTSQNPSHMYAASGTYTVQLIVTTNNGCKDTVSKSVTVYPKPAADYTFSNDCLDDALVFTDASSVTSGSVSSWAWTFGDGNSSSLQSPSNKYGASGTYTVTLISTTNYGCKDTVAKSAIVYPKPVADFSASNDCYGQNISFTNSSSVSSGSLTAHSWNFGDGNSSALQNPSNYYAASGTYTVTLITTSDYGCKDTVSKSVTVYPKPVANFSASNVCYGLSMNFTDGSSVSSGSVSSWSWNFGDGNSSSSQNPSNMYAAAGNYNVTLISTTALGCKDTVTKSVTVYQKPIADYTFSNSCLDDGISFTDASTVSSGTITTFGWTFGDSKTSSSQNPYHYYASSGTFTSTLYVTTNYGCLDTIGKSITVHPKPVANFTASNDCYGQSISFTDASSVSTGTVTAYAWTFGDGNSSSSQNPSNYYAASGTYTVTLVVTTDNSCKDTVSKSVTVYPKPVADFSTSNVCYGLNMNFTDASTVSSGSVSAWAWNFGDGNSSSSQNPAHMYGGSGTYTVTLIITTATSCMDTVSKSVTVYPKPLADYTFSNDCQDDGITFTDASTVSSGTVTTFGWTFGDSKTSSVQNPYHYYASSGTYTSTLYVTTNFGCLDTIGKSVTVYPKPVANFSTNNVCYGLNMNFSNTSSVSSGSLTAQSWTFGDGNSSTTASPTHMYGASGTYTVTLISTTDNGCKDTFSKSVTVYPKPIADYTFSNECLDDGITFTDASTVSSGTITIFGWTFGDNKTSSTQNPYHYYSSSGTYTSTLYITTNNGCLDTVGKSVTVYPKPVADFSFSNDCYGQSISFTGGSTVSSGSLTTYAWTFGDGNSSSLQNPSNYYAASGTYTVSLVVTTDNSCKDTISKTVTVYPKPIADFNFNNVCYGLKMNFTDASTVSSGSVSAWAWNFGDGKSSSSQNPSHLYGASGTYTVTLIITTGFSCKDTISKTVTVYPKPIADFTTTNKCQDEGLSFTDGSSVSSGSVTGWAWNFGDNKTGTAQNAYHYYTSSGNFNITLVASTNYGCLDTVTKSATVYPKPVSYWGATAACLEDSLTLLDSSSISSGSIISYYWNFGDNKTSTLKDVKHKYNVAAVYSVSHIVTSNLNCKDTLVKNITLLPKPTADFTFNDECLDDSVRFSDQSTVAGGVITNFYWEFADNNTSNDKSPAHKYAVSGSYNVLLEVTSGTGCKDSVIKAVTVFPKPQANFSFTNDCVYNTINFSNHSNVSSGSLTAHNWDFGDGNSSSLVNPTHKYASAGTYQVTLIITTDHTCKDTLVRSIYIHPKPVSAFAANNECLDDTVRYTNNSTVSWGGFAANYWTFGDGAGSNLSDPIHKYNASGTYNPQLIVLTDSGCYDTSTIPVTVYPKPAAIFSSANECLDDTLSFTNSSTVSSGSLAAYDWDFDDGNSSTLHSPKHKYIVSGTYDVQLIVTTDNTCKDTLVKTMTVYPKPLADFQNTAECVNEIVSFTDLSNVSSGSITSYLWDMGDQSGTTTVKNPLHLYNAQGAYNVKLIVTSNNSCKDTVVKVVNISPVPTASFTFNNNCFGDSTSFTNGSSISSGTISYVWNFGDASSSTQQHPKHLYASAGSYTVSLKVTSNNGCEDTYSSTVTIYPLPLVNFAATDACYGQANSFTNYSTGSSAFTWDFDDGNSSTMSNPSHMYAASGTYQVKLTASSSYGCIDFVTKSTLVNAKPVSAFNASNTCENSNVAFTNTTTISSSESMTHAWDFDDNNTSTVKNPDHTYTSSGTYGVELISTSSKGCKDTVINNITIYDVPFAVFSVANVCASDSAAFVNSSTIQSGSMTYNWNLGDGAGSTSANPKHFYASSGTYTVTLTVTSDKNCVDVYSSQITVYPMPVVAFTTANVCDGSPVSFNNNSTVSSGTNSYVWAFGDGNSSTTSSPTHTYASSGTYAVKLTATTDKGCTSDLTKQLVIYPEPVASFTTANVCYGDSASFSNTSTLNSGTATYAWSFGDGSSSSALSPKHLYAAAGTYTVSLTVTSDQNCTDVYTTTITVHPVPVVAFTAADVCYGNSISYSNSSSISSGSLNFLWNFGDANTSINISPTHMYAASGQYSVKLTATSDKGCVRDLTKQVEVYPLPVASFAASNVCDGNGVNFTNNSSISSGTMSASWNFGDAGSSTSMNPNHTYSSSGTYTVVLTITSDKGCVDNYSSTVTVYPAPIAGFTTSNDCNGNQVNFNNTSSISSGTNTYSWLFGDGSGSNNVSPGHTYAASGTYQVTLVAMSNNGCNDTIIKSVMVYPSPTASFSVSDKCFGDSVATVNNSSISSGTISHFWSFGDGDTSVLSNPKHLYAAAGTYTITLTVTSGYGCQSTSSQTVTVYPAPTAAFTANDDCYGYSIAFQNTSTVSSGSNTFSWDFGDGNSSNNVSPNHLYAASGTYSVKLTATTDKGCTDLVTNSVTVYPEATASFTASNVCDGAAVAFTNTSTISSGSMTFLWNFGDGSSSTSISPSHTYTTAGTYNVKLTVTTDKGCVSSLSMNITVYPRASVSFTTANVCDGNSASFTNTSTVSSGSLTYLWNFGDGGSSNNVSPTHQYNTAGTYQVKLIATTNNGCMDSTVGNISIYPKPIAGFSVSAVCNGENTSFNNMSTISSGTMNYVWNFGDGSSSTSTNPQHMYAASGTYTVTLTVTSDKGCSDVYTSSATVNPMPVPDFSAANICVGNAVVFNNSSTVSSGTNSYLWNFGDGNSSVNISPNHTYASDGTYSVKLIATTDKGCMDSLTKQVVVYPEPVAGFTAANMCDGSPMNFNNISSITSGTLTYDWNFGDGNSSTSMSPSHTYAGQGTYTVILTVTSAMGCTDVFTKDVTVYPMPVADFTANNACFGNAIAFTNNSTIFSGSMSFGWDFGDGNSSAIANPSHNYAAASNYTVILTVTSGFGCVDYDTVVITVYSLPSIAFTIDDITCFGMSNGQVVVHAFKGATPYMYSLNGGTAQYDSNFFNLQKGAFQVIVTDNNGCTNNATGGIQEPTEIKFTLDASDVLCIGGNSGSIKVNASGGTGTLTYSNNGGQSYQSSNTFSNLVSAYYVVSVKDANGCSQSQGIHITEPLNALDISVASLQDANCKGDNSGSVTFTSSGGTGIPEYSIDGTNYQSKSMFGMLSAGSYTGYVQDENGCVDNVSFVISEPANTLTIDNVIITDVLCHGGVNGMLNILASGGTAAYVYSIDGGIHTKSTPLFDVLIAGSYIVHVTDSKGCTAMQTVGINEPSQDLGLSIISINNSNCPKDGSGSFEVGGTGGTPAYTYSKDGTNFQASGLFTGLDAGDYVVIVNDDNLCEYTSLLTINFDNPAPIAAFDFIINNNAVSFINKSQFASSYLWDFDDGNSSTLASPVHIYTSDGSYDITLIATNSCTSDTATGAKEDKYITIQGTGYEEFGEGSGVGVKVYPTPTNGELSIKFISKSALGDTRIRVYAMDARMVFDNSYRLDRANGQLQVDLDYLSKGAYMIEISTVDQIFKKLIIKK